MQRASTKRVVVLLGATEWIHMAHLSFRKSGFFPVFERENALERECRLVIFDAEAEPEPTA